MKIDFSYLNQTANADKEINGKEKSPAAVHRTDSVSGYQLDISGRVMDNAAYGHRPKQGHGKTLEECMQEIGQKDNIALQHNYMAVMSNSLSTKDLAKMMKDGIDPRKMPAGDVVTILDKIKVTLIQSGVDIAGFTDTVDSQTAQAVTGSKGRAAVIESKLKENDLPVSKQNVEQSEEALQLAEDVMHLSDSTKKYMVENGMEPTIENIYFAQFSSGSNSNVQPRGYFAVESAGYYAKKADTIDWEQLNSQIQKIIEESGLTVSDETVNEAEWLVQEGIPLTKESLILFHEINSIRFPIDENSCMDAIADAISNGKSAKEALLSWDHGIWQKAQEIVDTVNQITNEQVSRAAESGKELTIENLVKEENGNPKTWKQSYDETAARRILEETRLLMTTEANLKLLKSGYSIETAPLEELVEKLKAAEQQYYRAWLGEDTPHIDEKVSLYKETESKTASLASCPAAVLGRVKTTDTFTLDDIYVEGSHLKSEYERANQSYEALRTQVRGDLGDSIRKAFRNVDDILTDMGIEKTPENQRAVRILGYNRMEITEENIARVKEADRSVNNLLDQMTPGMTWKLIREGVNPLTMDIESLSRKIAEYSDTVEEQTEKYSEFLFKLEKNNEITSEERESFIGIYRLFHQIENADGAAVGSVLNQQNVLSLKNLLSAVRSSKKAGINISVDDSFGGIDVTYNSKSITEQIESSFREMNEFLSNQDSQDAYYEEVSREIQEAAAMEDRVIEELLRFDQPVTTDNVIAQNALMNHRGSLFKSLFQKADEMEEGDGLKEKAEHLYEDMDDPQSIQQAYREFTKEAESIISKSLDVGSTSYFDIKQMKLLCKELSLNRSLASEGNYEIPVETEDGYTSIRLRIRHGEGSGRVEVAMQTEQYGEIMAEFLVKEGKADGYMVGSREESLALLNSVKEEMISFFEESGKEIKTMTVSISHSLDINKSVTDDGKESKTETRELYGIAKQIINAFRKSMNAEKMGGLQ